MARQSSPGRQHGVLLWLHPPVRRAASLWERYESAGWSSRRAFERFRGQEPKNESEIAQFCQGAFGITFPLTSKQAVPDPQAIRFIAGPAKPWCGQRATMELPQYLVGRDGLPIGSYGTGDEPLSPTLIQAIETALGPKSKVSSRHLIEQAGEPFGRGDVRTVAGINLEERPCRLRPEGARTDRTCQAQCACSRYSRAADARQRP